MALSCSKKLSALLRGITSKHHGDFYSLNCLYSFVRESKHESKENTDICNVVMPSENNKILEFNQYQKSDKAPFVIHVDLKCLIGKIDRCKNDPENSFTTKESERLPSHFSMSTISSFKSIENKHDVYRGKDFMKKFCESGREHAMKVINFKKKKLKLLTKEQQESYGNAK